MTSTSYICSRCKTQLDFVPPDNGWMLWMGWIMIALGLFGPPLVFLWPLRRTEVALYLGAMRPLRFVNSGRFKLAWR